MFQIINNKHYNLKKLIYFEKVDTTTLNLFFDSNIKETIKFDSEVGVNNFIRHKLDKL
jgi:hypothetical protein